MEESKDCYMDVDVDIDIPEEKKKEKHIRRRRIGEVSALVSVNILVSSFSDHCGGGGGGGGEVGECQINSSCCL